MGESNLFGLKDNLIVYISSETHSSIEKAAMISGIGSNNVRSIEVDDNFSMDVSSLKKQIKKDIENGHIPFFACATLGTTSSTGIDSVKEIGKVCDQYDLWMHVDAAMAGTASLCPEYQYIQEGYELR